MPTDLEFMAANARTSLLELRNAEGHWAGHLSNSALATATAVTALRLARCPEDSPRIDAGLRWLLDHQNVDGGWGDTPMCRSNLSTTLLVWGAVAAAAESDRIHDAVNRARGWIERNVGTTEPDQVAAAVGARYGKDRTFAAPILMHSAICGALEPEASGWRRVASLPYELAAFPRSWYAALRLPVVSYALPALIAIGRARFRHAPPPIPISTIRRLVWPKVSRLLREIQPADGGYLEATPLTAFVVMALISSGHRDHPVVQPALQFLRASVRADGSWPVDTNLSTWCTTLSSHALSGCRQAGDFPIADRTRIRSWLLAQQYRRIHPYTGSPPGAWAWTDRPGGVPDADDTAGALVALRVLGENWGPSPEAAINWLLQLQNRDGGIPTFCRGWGALPFDRSAPDLTAHALRAFFLWRDAAPPAWRQRMASATAKGLAFLQREQAEAGYWNPLWFGNEHAAGETNPVYGTAMVLQALELLTADPNVAALTGRGRNWLVDQQNTDGGWGGAQGCPSSIEETGLAMAALAGHPNESPLRHGLAFLAQKTDHGRRFPPAPIGLYFAKLWYHESTYPVIWTVAALEKLRARWNRRDAEVESTFS